MGSEAYEVCIVGGLGHVGLPLGISLAQSGKKVVLYDINQEAIDAVKNGRMPFMEEGAEKILQNVLNNKLFISKEKDVISKSHFIVIVIGTPVDEHLNPKFTIFKDFFSELLDYIDSSQHIILRSTVYPGTTEKVMDILRQNGKQTRISFCPERIAEGKAMTELRSLPQIIASFDQESINEVKEFFSCLTDDIVILEPIEAELAKLFTNVWRYIQFSISNQFYQIASQNGLDFYKVYNAIRHNYPRAQGFASAGFAAGPCLFKDTMQLATYSNNTFFLGHAAMLINEGLPNFIIRSLKPKYTLKQMTVGILGMAFKGNIDDNRESLSYKLKKNLEIEAGRVLCTDPFVDDPNIVGLDYTIKNSDLLILGAPHTVYKELKEEILKKPIVDVWNFFEKGGIF